MLKKRNHTNNIAIEATDNQNINYESDPAVSIKYITELAEQIQKQTDLVIKEEGFSTVNFNSLLNNEDYTKEQIHNVQRNLESVATSSDITKQSLENIIADLTASSIDLSNAKSKNEVMVSEMNNVIDVFEQFNVLFGELQKEYNQIENLASIISSIASRTKLLSLNASIEAARAGEQGKGFSVVAEEIKKLSENTQHNAKSIMDSLHSMTEVITKLNAKTEEGTQMMPSTQKLVEDSALTFHNITTIEDQLLHSLNGVMVSQDDNMDKITKVNTDLMNIINKTDADNTQYKNLVLGVQKKADYYLHILHYLKQIDILKEQLSKANSEAPSYN